MVFAALPTLQKNSLSTTTASNMTTSSTEVEVTEQAVFYREGVLLTHGWELGPDNAVEFRTEEVIVTSTDAVSGAGTVFFSTRAVKADGTNGSAYAWPAGTRIRNTLSTSVYDQIKDNFAALPQSRNLIINGDCRVNQRVTAYTLAKDAYTWDTSDLYGPDRHEGMATGTAVSAGTWGQTVTATAGHSGYAFTFAGVTLTGTGILYHRTRIEALDAIELKNQIASFGCYVWQDTGSAHNYTIYVRKANAADNFSAVTEIGHSAAQSVPSGGSSPGTFIKFEGLSMGDCSNGIEVEIKNECGAVTTKNFEQTELQLELGSVATAFESKLFTDEVKHCKRYFESSYSYGVSPGTNTNVGEIIVPAYRTVRMCGWLFSTVKRVIPTIYIWSLFGTANKVNEGDGVSDIGTNATTHTISTNGVSGLYDSSTPYTVSMAYGFHYVSACEL